MAALKIGPPTLWSCNGFGDLSVVVAIVVVVDVVDVVVVVCIQWVRVAIAVRAVSRGRPQLRCVRRSSAVGCVPSRVPVAGTCPPSSCGGETAAGCSSPLAGLSLIHI